MSSAVDGLRARAAHTAHSLRVLTQSGLLGAATVTRVLPTVRAARKWGLGPAAAYAVGAACYPDEPAVIDERGPLTFKEMEQRTNAVANAAGAAGISPGDKVAIMCRNHRGFVDISVGLAKRGADLIYLNTGFSGPQLADVTAREDAAAVVYDQEFHGLLDGVAPNVRRIVAWVDDEGALPAGVATLDGMIETGDGEDPPPPSHDSRIVILTSGTTGTPKGAARKQPKGLEPGIAFLSKIPLHTRETVVIAAPLFHSWGMAHLTFGFLLGSTVVLQRKFDPEATLEVIERTRARTLAVVPVMLQRILALDESARARYDTSSLQVVAASGSALPGPLASDFMDAFGDVLYNLYGSTEVAWATIATPADMRAAPGTAGAPPLGTTVRIYDAAGKEVAPGETGRIFVGNTMLFDGYTGGGTKDMIDGLMSTGDVGHLDAAGRLFVEGRDDEMIVSGGENVFPAEVEDLLAGHDAVAEVAVIGVDDDEFGQRLKAFVVRHEGASLAESDVKDYVRTNLARYKIPRDVEFLDELPRNATGKVLKRSLRER